MDQPAHAIRKEHVDLLRLDHGSYFTRPVGGMGQVLSRAIGARAIIGSAGFSAGAGRARPHSGLERTAYATLGTANSRDLAALRNRGDDVAALLLTLGAELVDAIANRVSRLFHLWLFRWHENKRGMPVN
jgi:hypothetical protein